MERIWIVCCQSAEFSNKVCHFKCSYTQIPPLIQRSSSSFFKKNKYFGTSAASVGFIIFIMASGQRSQLNQLKKLIVVGQGIESQKKTRVDVLSATSGTAQIKKFETKRN